MLVRLRALKVFGKQLNKLKSKRIGHGVRSIEDEKLIEIFI